MRKRGFSASFKGRKNPVEFITQCWELLKLVLSCCKAAQKRDLNLSDRFSHTFFIEDKCSTYLINLCSGHIVTHCEREKH